MFKTGMPAAAGPLIRKQHHRVVVEQTSSVDGGAEMNVPTEESQINVLVDPRTPHARLRGLRAEHVFVVFMSR